MINFNNEMKYRTIFLLATDNGLLEEHIFCSALRCILLNELRVLFHYPPIVPFRLLDDGEQPAKCDPVTR